MSVQTYSLNLSPRYVPDWGPWEVAREIICNAIDADPERMSVTTNGTDELVVKTTTVPERAELFVIGAGSKAPGNDTIGQFGEGFKLAALAATRSHGGCVEVLIPGSRVTFHFADSLGVEALHASVHPCKDNDGCEVRVKMQGVSLAFAGRLLPDRKDSHLNKAEPNAIRFYCKGVYIGETKESSIWDWNLSRLKINRDRSMVDTSSAWLSVSSYFERVMTDDMAAALVSRPLSWECNYPLVYTASKHCADTLAKAFRAHYGETAVIECDDAQKNAQARTAGHRTVACASGLASKLKASGVKSADNLLPPGHDFETADMPRYAARIERLRSLDALIGAPGFSVRVFTNRADHLKGLAVLHDNLVWLSEGLFTPGNELELVRTYLHEAGHIMSNAGDATTQFENALDGIAGRLAIALLGKESK